MNSNNSAEEYIESKAKRFFYLGSIALIIVIADQYTKYLVLKSISFGESIPVINGFFNLVLTFNKGVAFGVFADIENDLYRYGVLAVTTLIALGAVGYFAQQKQFQKPIPLLALGCIVGGAIGNITDRIRIGAVTDFLDFYIGTFHWPAFNIADSAICVAVGLLLFFTPTKGEETP